MSEIENAMDGAPEDEGPIGTVPKSAQQEDGELVADPFRFGNTVAPQRDVEIVAKPTSERDVPSFPKVRYGSREVWEIEVVA